jgi:hypothetical protein
MGVFSGDIVTCAVLSFTCSKPLSRAPSKVLLAKTPASFKRYVFLICFIIFLFDVSTGVLKVTFSTE